MPLRGDLLERVRGLRRKIVPRTGSLLIAPAAFTHTHRGNVPKGGDKYIATSWVLFQRAEAQLITK